MQSGASTVTAGGPAVGLMIGHKVTLKDINNKNEVYLPIAIHHHLTLNPLATGAAYSFQYNLNTELLSLANQYRYYPPRKTVKPVIYGLQHAKVLGPTGDVDRDYGLSHVDPKGRIKVQFLWENPNEKEQQRINRRCWVRVAQAIAGNGWGTQFIPRAGQEVLVSFIDGDPDKPIVVGSAYNSRHKMPFPEEKDTNNRGLTQGFRSNSIGKSPLREHYNELSFHDAEGEERINLQAEKDFDTFVKNNYDIKVDGEHSIEVGKNQTLAVDESYIVKVTKEITIKSNEKITLQAGTSSITMNKDGFIEIKGKQISVKGSDVDVQGNKVSLN